jgi:gamma-glutamyl hercynylcysteine S-oxide synthase
MMVTRQPAGQVLDGPLSAVSSSDVISMLRQFRERTHSLVEDLDDRQLIGPRLPTVNPPLWEIGHVGWFQELWALRHLRRHKPLLENGDRLYNSTDIAHDTRWELLLPSLNDTWSYLDEVLDRVIEAIDGRRNLSKDELYFYFLVGFHEAMHAEALACTRQTLGYPAPSFLGETAKAEYRREVPLGDVEIPGGEFVIGASADLPFVFDNEKWAHPVNIRPFRIARAPVTNGEYRQFVEDGGYRQPRWWSEDGRQWLETGGAPQLEKSFAKFFNKALKETGEPSGIKEKLDHPVYWRREANGGWQQRLFDRYVPLEDRLPLIHVGWYEAEAYCNWARRRLPSEAEWEAAASSQPASEGPGFSRHRHLFPWGDQAPRSDQANLDWRNCGPVEVSLHPAGDSPFGCRQMIGNIWEWTADSFEPYPGFIADPYKEYSKPWFGTHKVLRGGCWATSSLLIRNTWRNFYTPDRRDVYAGFRTCAK